MAIKKLNNISDIKTIEDLRQLKLKKKYEVELKRLEVQSSLVRVQMNLDPENIKKTLIDESRFYLQEFAMKYMPSFLFKFFRK